MVETRQNLFRNNQTWDYAKGVPIREQITIHLAREIFASIPTTQAIDFNITFYAGASMGISYRRHGFSHRLIGIFAQADGPDPIELTKWGSERYGTLVHIKASLRQALHDAVVERLCVGESEIQYLDRIIVSVT